MYEQSSLFPLAMPENPPENAAPVNAAELPQQVHELPKHTTAAAAVKYYPIDEGIARIAHEMMSMSDYQTGRATMEYRAAVDEAAALVAQRKQKLSPYYHSKLDALLDRYARKLAEWRNAYNRNGASCPSVLVCGAGNFPTRKKAKQNAREDVLWQEYKAIQAILDKIKSVGTGPVDLTDPYAREMLTDQLQRLQNQLDDGKAQNAYYRKHKTMKGFPGMSDEIAARNDAALVSVPSFAQRPVPDSLLASLRGKIKRVKARIAELDRLQAQQANPAAAEEHDGFRIIRNAAENRLQIIFDSKPDADTREALKTNGFRWSPRNQAWQRQLTANAESAARRALGLD